MNDTCSTTLDQIFSLYRESFLASERRTESDLRRALAGPDYQVLTRQDSGKLIGFAIVFAPVGHDFALLEYLAVAPMRQGSGIGRELVLESIEKARGRCVITEVESQTDDPATLRRQNFYRRCGFGRLERLKYQLPLPGNPPPMELWANPSSVVNEANLKDWIRTIYAQVYHCRHDDPRIGEILADLAPEVNINRF